MAEKEVAIKLKLEGAAEAGKSLSELKKEFKEQQKELEKLAVGSKEYLDQLKKLGEIRDDIGDLSSQINTLGSNANKLQAVGKVANGIAGGFSAATGAAALFGSQSQEVEQALLKVQSALAIQQGISAVLELGDSFKELKLVVKDIGNVIKGNPIFFLASVVIGIVTAFVGLEDIMAGIKIAFNAIGEAAVAVFDGIVEGVKFAIDLYTQYLDLLTFGLFDINEAYRGYIDNIEEANEAERRRIEALKEEEKQIKENIDALVDQISAVRKAEQAVADRQKAVEKAYDIEIRLANAAGKNTEELEKKKLEDVKKSIEERIKLKIQEFELEQKLVEEQIKLSNNLSAQGNDLVAAGNKQFAKDLEKRANDTKAFIQGLQDELLETETQLEVNRLEKQKEAYDKWKELEEQRTKDLEAQAKLRQAIIDEEAAFQRQKQKEANDEYLRLQKEKGEEEVVINFDVLDAQSQANEAYAAKEIDTLLQNNEFEKQAAEQRVALALSTIQALSAINELFGAKNEKNAKKAFEINKALQIATALIQTYQSATGAYASQIAIPTPDAPIRAAIAAGVAIASGLAQVAKISATKFESNSVSGGGSAPSVPSVGAPSTGSNNQINTTLLDREAIESGQQQQEPIQVYVTESDISQTQRRVNGIVNRATVR